MILFGIVIMRVFWDEYIKNLVKNIVCENWCEVFNVIFKYKEFVLEINIVICKVVFKEFSDYFKCESMLFVRNLDEFVGFFNKLFMEEI